jgi:mono/diheme cytochrome c family protein
MVPDLKNQGKVTDREHWVRWITFGRHGSLMPAFAQSEGGPLTDEQIDSLADYLNRAISQRPMAQGTRVLPRPVALPPLPGAGASLR